MTHTLTPNEQLRMRAHRMLRDGLPHSDQAIAWALATLNLPSPELVELEHAGDMRPFTARELSLGATRWA